jgi:hypothetical protein
VKGFHWNIILFCITLLSAASGFFFSSALAVLGIFQLGSLPSLINIVRSANNKLKLLLKIYLFMTIVVSACFCLGIYYLNVRRDLFDAFHSTEDAINFLLKFFLLPAIFHVGLHWRAQKV